MQAKVFSYPITILESYLDVFGHVNNAMYLTLLEEARWDLITKNGYGLNKILSSGQGPVILDIKLQFLKELLVREEIVIETQLISQEEKIGKLAQRMIRNNEICCQAEFTFAFFSLKDRKIIKPSPEWLQALGLESSFS